MCGLALAWVTSENSTSTGMPTSFDSIFFAVAGPSLLCYCLRSPVLTAPVRGSTLTLSAVPPPTASQLLCPANSHSRPLTTSGYGEISGPRILCLVSHQNRQRNRLLWRATHIVRQNCNILTPSSGHSSISFPFSWAAQPGFWGPSFCWDIVLIQASSLQLI